MSMPAVSPPPIEDDIGTLARFIAGNRFMPVPPGERSFVGDGDFRAIGAEFLTHFVRLGGLDPHDRVLEIGCGIGRMALPLTQYLSAPGRYTGVDVVAAGIAWCADTITPVYPDFSFRHIDLRHDIYNPGGSKPTEAVALPFADGGFDFIYLTSVLTHLRTAEVVAYVAEIARLLRPGGRCLVSLFLLDGQALAGLRAGRSRLPFDPDAAGPEHSADPDHPTGAVAYDEVFLIGLFEAAGLPLARPVVHGHWSGGRPAEGFQDICVFAKGAK